MSVSLSTIFNGYQSFLANGLPNAGGFIYTYQAGTTTPAATYTTSAGNVANANPIPLSAGGTPPNTIWLTDGASYKMVIVDATLAQVPNGTFDNITGSSSSTAGLQSSIAAAPGATLVGLQAAGTGSVATTVKDFLDGIVYVWSFLSAAERTDVLARTLTLDVSASVQKAINASVGRKLVWPAGSLLIGKCLNSTGRGSSSAVWEGQGFDADMSSGTIVVARTAVDGTLSPGWIADFTGSQNTTIREMNFWGAGTNAATKGLLFARTAGVQYVQQTYLDKVCVKVATAPAATTIGSVAICNNQAEQFKTNHCAFYADSPMPVMLNNELTVVSPYSLINSAILSTSAMQFSATTFYAYTQSAMTLWGVNSANWDNSCVFARATGNTTQYAIDIRASGVGYQFPHALNICGQVEGFPGAVTFSSSGMQANGVNTNLLMVALGAACVVTSTGVTLNNCEFNNPHPQNITGAVNLSCGAGSAIYGGKTVCYQNDLGVSGSPINDGHLIVQNASGGGLKSITVGANISSLGSPNAAQSRISSDGRVILTGILQASASIASGITIGTLDPLHRPNRTVPGSVFISGIGLTYITITSAGLLTVGSALVNTSQVNLDSVEFYRVN